VSQSVSQKVSRAPAASPGSAPGRPPRRRPPRPPLTSEPLVSKPLPHQERLTAALDAADRGDTETALGHLASVLADNPLDPDAHFIDGLVALEADRPAGAAAALRRALCADASFGLAAFTLARAYDALGDKAAALRSYGVALRTLDPADKRHGRLLQQVDIGDITSACRARLGATP
jgi:tetratricopeptide (TPR) repeat protein